MNPYNNGLNEILRFYANEYQKDGKVFVKCFLNCASIRMVCRSIVSVYKKEMGEIRQVKCVEYAKRFETDRETLADILSIIYYCLN